MNTSQIVEAVLFASDAPLTPDEIARADSQLDEDLVETALKQLQAEYDDAQRAFELREVADGYQILTNDSTTSLARRVCPDLRSRRWQSSRIDSHWVALRSSTSVELVRQASFVHCRTET